jgi:hypothetical protein
MEGSWAGSGVWGSWIVGWVICAKGAEPHGSVGQFWWLLGRVPLGRQLFCSEHFSYDLIEIWLIVAGFRVLK